ncbi:hypothetical protein FGIG_11168 [Fasciola gigantica]|uniref:Uncharacterized protein n=1 Tax=Fasciola gigantica TaxID=46835 RepID=A0A504YN93_FASGI|nr:hypothetical protein FGIG_11168 [Fasciola gigantica]
MKSRPLLKITPEIPVEIKNMKEDGSFLCPLTPHINSDLIRGPSTRSIAQQAGIQMRLSIEKVRTLLRIFTQVLPNLPTDPRILLKSPPQAPKKSVGNGKYVHFVLDECLWRVVYSSVIKATDEIAIQLYADSRTLFPGLSHQLRLILGRVPEPLSRVLMAGLYCGMTQPEDVMKYLDDCARGLKSLLSQGMYIRRACRRFRVVFFIVTAEAPAKALVKKKNHSDYSRSPRCTQRGSNVIERRMFLASPGKAGTKADHRSRRQQDLHTQDSSSESLSNDAINTFPTDYLRRVS